jgi:exo-1,4-beta-D-glucosaminidase
MAYDGERAMFEAYARNKYDSTGVIQWMLNNAWPSMIWHLYDYYLAGGGGYYGARKACEPLHVQYSYDDRSVVLVNSTYKSANGVHVKGAVYDLNLKPVFEHEVALDAEPDSSTRAFHIPEDALSGGLHFVRLTLTDNQGQEVSNNFYTIPAKLAEFDWGHGDYRYTPALQEPDLTALKDLPHAHVVAELLRSADDGAVRIRLRNDSPALAFQIALEALDPKQARIDPVFWSDNYLSLMPGESRILTVKRSALGGPQIAAIALTGWNIDPERLIVTGNSDIQRRDQQTAALPFARASASASQPRLSDDTGILDR